MTGTIERQVSAHRYDLLLLVESAGLWALEAVLRDSQPQTIKSSLAECPPEMAKYDSMGQFDEPTEHREGHSAFINLIANPRKTMRPYCHKTLGNTQQTLSLPNSHLSQMTSH